MEGVVKQVMRKSLIIILAVVIILVATFLVLKFSNDEITITIETLDETLEPISELSTSAFEYTGEVTRSSTRTGLGMNIPGTTNSVTITYSGVIKVGYDVDAIQESIDNEQKIIKISLPEPQIFGNYIDTQNLEFETSNNIFNPIDAEDLFGYLKEIQADELDRAIAAGMYETAEGQIESLITGLLAVFPDYTVQFGSVENASAAQSTETPEATDAAKPTEAPGVDQPEEAVA